MKHVIASLVLVCSTAGAAELPSAALPTGGTVVAGQAVITSNGTRMDITQDTQRAIINWQGFDIGSDAKVTFIQPGNDSVTLNRVTGPNASRIEGQFSANGQVFLVNPNGVLFGGGARVNASALVASTLDIRDNDFLAGHYAFSGVGGAIENSGSISAAAGGYVAFIAPTITNSGTVDAPQGTVALGAGERVTLNFLGNRLIGLSIATDTLNTLIDNRQAIRADSGTILLSAAGAEALSRSVINQSGILEASSLTESGGHISLSADEINVSSTSTFSANALHNGDGGSVLILADDAARMYGAISARGGATSGNGGFAEVSGKQRLDYQGLADLRAPNGSTGTLLLDPTDITISGASSTATLTTPSNLNVTTLTNQLALGNVTVSTASALAGSGDITVNNAINYASANTLTLSANRTITLVAGSGGINNSGTGAVTLTGAGAGSIAVNESIATGGGAIALTSGTGGVTLAASKSIDAASGTIAINAGGGAANFSTGTLRSDSAAAAINVTNATTLALGNVTLNGGGTLSVSHSGAGTQTSATSISGTGALNKAGSGTLTLSQTNTYTGPTAVNAGTLSVSGSNAIVDTGAVMLADVAGVALNVTASETIGSLSGGGTSGGNVTKSSTGAATLTTGRTGDSTTFAGVIQNGSGTISLVKEGSGTFTLANTNTYTGTTAVNGGTLALSGASGSATGSNLTVNADSRLVLDNSAANNNDRVGGTLTLNGGEFTLTGSATANTAESLGALSLASGYSTVTLTPDVAQNTQLTFASLARTAGASALFRGDNLGANTVASQTAGNSNIVFTTVPTLTGGAGNSGTSTVSIVSGVIGAGGASGSSSSGTDFVTYNPPTGALNGLRPLLGSEYAAAPATNVNLKLTANRVADDTFSINSLLMSGGVTYSNDSTGVANTLTIASGNVLSLGATNTLQPTLATGTVAFGSTEAKVFTLSDLVLGSNAQITGSAVLGKSGSGTLLANRAVSRTGGIIVNSGTLRAGIANSFVSQALTVRPAGALDLNGFNHTLTSLTLESGAISGASVMTGAGVLTLAGNVALNVNGSGFTGASISGSLTSSATRTFTVANGVAADDLTISALIGGAGGVTKAGTGTMTPTGSNTYTGVTNISAGTWSANVLADGGVASSIGASTSAATNLVLGNSATLLYTGATASSNRDYSLTAGQTSSVNVVNSATNLTFGGSSIANTGALTKLGSGTLTVSGTNLHTGVTTVSGGTLALGANDALSGAVTIAGGATFDVGSFSDTVGVVTLTNGTITGTSGVLTGTGTTAYAVSNGVVSAILGGAGGLTKATTGTVNLTRANTYTGATTANAGILSVTSLGDGATASNIGASTNAAANLVLGGGILQYSGPTASTDRNYTLTAGTTSFIDIAGSTELTLGGAGAATTGALTKLGDGTLTLTGANANTGTTTLRSGTLQVGNGGATGSLGSGAVVDQGRLVLNRNNALTLGSVVSGFGELIQQGSGTTTLTAANTYTGATTIGSGTLQLGAANRITDSDNVTVAAGATFNLANFAETLGSISGAGNITLGSGTLTSGGNNASTTFDGVISGTGGITKAGTGTLTLSGANLHSGLTTVSGGTLAYATNDALGSGGLTITNGSTVDIGGYSDSVGVVTLTSGTLTGTTGVLTRTGTTTVSSGVVSAILDGTGGLTKSTTGTVTLTRANTYSGTTTVSAGTLVVNNDNALGATTGGTTVSSGATLNLNNVDLPGEAITTSGSGVAGAGAISSTGAVSTSGNVTLAAASTFGTTTSGSSLTVGGIVTAPTTLTFAGPGSFTASNAANNFSTVATSTAANITLRDTNNITLNASTLSGALSVRAGGTVTVAGAVSAAATGDAIVLSGSRFVNNAGASGLSTANGRWLVWSSNAAPFGNVTPDLRNGLAFDFKQYAATYGVTPVAQPAGNGFLYSLAPVITPVLTGTTSKGYDGTAVATLGAANYSATGAVDGDSVNLTSTGAMFNNRNAGTGKGVTASGLSAAYGNGNAAIYGYSLASTAATANIGTITPAALTVTAQADNRIYNGSTSSGIAPLVTGATYDDAAAATQAFDDRNVGANKTLTASGLVLNDGNAGANYTISYVNNTSGVITPALLTVSAQPEARVYDGTTASSVAPLVTGSIYDPIGSAATQGFDNRNAGNGKTLTASGLVVNDGNAGANYTVNYVTSSTGVITAAPLSVVADDKTRPARTPNPPFTATYVGLVGGDAPADLGGTLEFSTSAKFESRKGYYPITPAGLSSTNYNIEYMDGVLKVTAQLRPPEYAAWSRFNPQSVARGYTDPAPHALPLPKATVGVVSGGLNTAR